LSKGEDFENEALELTNALPDDINYIKDSYYAVEYEPPILTDNRHNEVWFIAQ
jgi:hypothetical protein